MFVDRKMWQHNLDLLTPQPYGKMNGEKEEKVFNIGNEIIILWKNRSKLIKKLSA